MTFLEKAMEINEAEGRNISKGSILNASCPSDYDLEGNDQCNKVGENKCIDCWNREMPNTEPQVAITKDDLELKYSQGLNDAWELVKKLWYLENQKCKEVFGYEFSIDIIEHFTPQEALAKLKAYEETQIKVGDIVFCFADCDENWRENKEHYGVLLEIVNDIYTVLMKNGDVSEFSKNSLEKTGKHIDIQSILKQIRNK